MIKKLLLSASAFVACCTVAFAQPALDFVDKKQWNGPYDIKMIGAPNVEPVYVNQTEALSGKLLADSLIPYKTMIIAGDILEINNSYEAGATFYTNKTFGLQAVLCPDPNMPCSLGITQRAPNTDCPVRYNNPTMVTKSVSRTYADYDKDNTTFSSSMAELDIPKCSEVETAYLYWMSAFRGSKPNMTLMPGALNSFTGDGSNVFNVSATSGYDTVLFKTPGSSNYVKVTAGKKTGTLCVADVTNIVKGSSSGAFWVANLQAYPNTNGISGWNLVVVYKSPLSPPRSICLWNGFTTVGKGVNKTFNLSGFTAPATTNIKSFVGIGVTDGENIASQLSASEAPEGITFQTGGAPFVVNPFCDGDQPKYKRWTDTGLPALANGDANTDGVCNIPLFDANWATVCDGISSSHITTYDEKKGTNGNEIVRLPSNKNTLGLDIHHIKLPDGAITPNSTSGDLTINGGQQGSIQLYLAYIAVESLQPKLTMTKSADKNSIGLDSIITYTLKLKNEGNDKTLGDTLGGDIIYDSLDVATDYVPGSFSAPAGVTLTSSANDSLEIKIASKLQPQDSIEVSFKVKVKNLNNGKALFDACKRTITNTAYVKYNTLANGQLLSKSNSNDCGIGTETRVSIVDPLLITTKTPLPASGSFDGCAVVDSLIFKEVRAKLKAAGVADSNLAKFEIRDAANNSRVRPEDVFGPNGGTYLAIRDLASGQCQEIYEVKFPCAVCVPPVTLSFSQGTLTACQGDSKTLTANYTLGAPLNSNYYITYFRNATPLAAAVTISTTSTTDSKALSAITPAMAGTYKVRIEDGNNSISNCYKEASVIVKVDSTIQKGTIGPEQTLCGRPDSLTAVAPLISLAEASGGDGIITYAWEKSDNGSSWSGITPAVTSSAYAPPSLGITTYYRRKAISGTACPAAYAMVAIIIKDCQALIIPDIITPNGDALNQTLTIQGNQPESTIEIFNRWGKKIYQKDNYDNSWDGDGCSDGIYYYIYKRKNDTEAKTGWVQIATK